MSTHDEKQRVIRHFMELMGFDVDSDGMHETDARFVKFYEQYFPHYDDPIEEAVKHLKSFESPKTGGLVNVSCSFSAFCEHHLLPFFGTAQIVYLPNGKITGLSKMSRILRVLCSRPQVQERITSQMTEVMMRFKPLGVLVDINAEHTCMKIRGITDPCSSTRTQETCGVFETDSHLLHRALSTLK